MSLLTVAAISAGILLIAYRVYGRYLARLLRLDPAAETPAVALKDGVDFDPIAPAPLFNQHFSAIAAAGPIVGPILAGVMFGWVPAILWILIGSIFVGGVHDITALVASIRHRARSIAEVVREHMSRRSYVLFLLFVWLALIYIIVAFTDITTLSFVGLTQLDNGEVVSGPGIATSSILYLILPVMMGLVMRFTRMRLSVATIIFLPLVGLSIWVGQYIPLNLAGLLGVGDDRAHKVWNMLVLGYCFVASLVPMWCLLQPRGHLGGYFLIVSLAGCAIGLLFGGERVQYPAFRGWEVDGAPLLPMLFITIACGACSGFHSIVASGTTSKQLRRETDAKAIGYGAMLLEGMVAVVSLCCVMRLSSDSALMQGGLKPNQIYAQGLGSFLGVVGISPTLAVSFGLMAFTTFVYDTLDVCTRLGRYILEELLGLRGRVGRSVAAIATVAAPAPFLLYQSYDAAGRPVAAWRIFWELFGASNQLLAALTLLGVTVWLWRTRRSVWLLAVTVPPTVLMYAMSTWALLRIIRRDFARAGSESFNPVPWVACLLVALALMMLVDAAISFLRPVRSAAPLAPAPALGRADRP